MQEFFRETRLDEPEELREKSKIIKPGQIGNFR